jgi:SAM-dependent methyltransferase
VPQGSIEAYYRRHDDFRRYSMEDAKRVKELSRLYDLNKGYFGKRVLDLACGGGILGFIVERHGHDYVGVDLNRDMIGRARAYARRTGSRNRFLLADATRDRVQGTFETVAVLGNALCHFNTMDFGRLLKNVEPSADMGSHFIVDYRDVVDLLFRRKWKSKLVEKEKGKVTVSRTTGCDTERGDLVMTSQQEGGSSRVEFTHAVWAPFIIEPMMESSGWKLARRKRLPRWFGWLDVYEKL